MALTQASEEGLKISNAGTNGQYLQKQSGNTGGLTWADVNTDLVSDTSPQLGGDLDVNTKNISFGDSSDGSSDDVLKFGAGNDLTIFHNGSASYIKDTGTGNLVLASSLLQITNAGVSENMAKFIEDGAVELYYNGGKRIETTSVGVSLSGELNMVNNHFYANDNAKLRLGTGQDLQIYHDGTKSYIDNNTGDLEIQTPARIELQGNNGSETMARYTSDGPVELFYDNSKKFETTSGGATVTGALTVDNAGGNAVIGQNLSLVDNGKVKLGTGDDLEIYHDGSNNIIKGVNGYIQHRASAHYLNNADSSNNFIRCETVSSNDLVSLHFNGSKKFETTSAGITVTGAITAGNGNGINWGDTSARIIGESGGSGYLRFDTNGGEKLRIDSSGDMILGSTSSLGKLTISKVQNNLSSAGGFANPHLRLNATTTTDNNGFTGVAYSVSELTNYGWTAGAQRVSTSGTDGAFIFRHHSNSATGNERVRFLSSGGITFNGDSAAANALDDYEEGTWTATCNNGVTLSSGVDLCQYVKIGRQVTVRGQILISDSNGNSDFEINNLPFANGDVSEDAEMSVGMLRLWNLDLPSDTIDVLCAINGSNSNLQFWRNRDNTNAERLDADDSAYVAFTITYFTA